MALGAKTRTLLMAAAWTVMCLSGAMLVGLAVGRPLYYSDGFEQVAGSDLRGAGMLRWPTPMAEGELPGRVTGRVCRLADGRLLYAVLGDDQTSDLYTWDPAAPTVPPEPAYGLNTPYNELAAAVDGDGRVYFASDRPESIGGYDLFVATVDRIGFGRAQPLAPCNTALDETDPAVDARGTIVFVRIDRRIDDGNDGVLWRWQLGDPQDPEMLFDGNELRRNRAIDRDPVFAADGASLWFVRQQFGQPLRVVRSSRLGERFDRPIEVSTDWAVERLRSPVPSADGRSVAFLQPPQDDQPALWFVSTAEELVPWWPGQEWLEWLLWSLLACSALLLLLLYLGRRWSALDLVAQCLLLSLLVHILLFLWLMGVEIAGSLLPGSDDDDSGMQVSIVASASASSSSGGGGGDIAAKVRRESRERSFDVVQPTTGAERSALEQAAALQVDNGSYEAEPSAAEAATASVRELSDAAAAIETRDGVDAAAEPSRQPLQDVESRAEIADAIADRSSSAAADQAVRVELTSPDSGMARVRPSSLAGQRASAGDAMPAPAPAASTAAADRSATRDRVAASHTAASRNVADAGPAPVEARADAAATAPRASELSANRAPQGADRSASASLDVARPGSELQRGRSGALPAAAASLPQPAHEVVRGSRPGVALREAPKDVGDGPRPAEVVADADASIERSVLPQPNLPRASALSAARAAALGSRPHQEPKLPMPGSTMRRATPKVSLRAGIDRELPSARRGAVAGAAVALRDGGAAAVSRPRAPSSAAPSTAAIAARSQPAVDAPTNTPSFAPKWSRQRRSQRAGAFAERWQVAPPGVSLARAAKRAAALPEPVAAPVAQNAYSNRFGPEKAKALERFGGTEATERAVRDGLRYLAGIQNRNGSWGNQRDYDGKYGFVYIGKTALCVLAFLGAGHTPTSNTEHSAVVTRAIEHLLEVQDEDTGAFGRSSCYGHGITTYAIAECYGLTKDKALLRPLEDGLTWILANQGPRGDVRNRGGWGYFSPGLRAEDSYARVSVSSWMIMALESARMSGIELPEETLPAARRYLELSFDRRNGWFRYNHKPSRLRSGWPTLPASTPAGAFCMMLLGAERDHEMVEVAVDYTVARRPQRYRRYSDDDFVMRGQGNVYFWYYGSLCCFLAGGEQWQRWNARLSTVLPAAQAEDGSFPPIDVYSREAGDTRRDRSYTTAMCVLSLEVYYRYFTPLLLGR